MSTQQNTFNFMDTMDYIPSSFYEENDPVFNSILKTIFENFDVLFQKNISDLDNLRDPRTLNIDTLLLLLKNLGFFWDGAGKIDEDRLRYLANYLPYYYRIAGSGSVCITDTTKFMTLWRLDKSKLNVDTVLANDWNNK